MKPYYPASQLIINEDGSIFHLHIRPEQGYKDLLNNITKSKVSKMLEEFTK